MNNQIKEDMKLHKYMFASLSFCSLVLGSCQNNDIDDEHHYDNKVFVTSQQVRDDLLIKETVSETTRSISYRLADPLDREVNISFDAAPQLTAAYNLAFNDSAQVLAADYYEIPVKSVTIKAGDISSDDVVVNFKNTNQLDKSRRYVLPVTITDADIEVLDSKRTAYFIFKGAALINVVANIEKIYFPISWKTDMSNVNAITVDDFLAHIDYSKCIHCGKPLEDETKEYCRDCERRKSNYEQGRSLWVHIPPVSNSVYRLKYHNKRYYAEIFGKELADEFEF